MLLLLTSVALAAPWRAAPEDVVPVLSSPVGPWVILAVEAPGEWSGPQALWLEATGENGQRALVGAPAVGLPAGLEAWRGRAVTVQTADGSCSTAVSELDVISRASWMEGFSEWARGGDCEVSGGVELSAACRQAQVNEVLSFNERLLVGKLAGCGGDEGVVAVAQGGTAPIAWRRDADEDVRGEALERMRAAARWQGIEARWKQEPGAEQRPEWQDEPEIGVFTLGRRTWVTLTARVGGCGDFEAELWLGWEVKRRHRWVELPADEVRWFPAEVAADVDGDGVPTLLNSWGIVSKPAGAAKLGDVTSFEEPWMGCPC